MQWHRPQPGFWPESSPFAAAIWPAPIQVNGVVDGDGEETDGRDGWKKEPLSIRELR
jgi:hypothetical protein